MMRIGMTLAAVVLGGVVLSAGEAGACEGHRAGSAPPAHASESDARPPVETGSTQAAGVQTAPADEPHAARCQCGSAADCTCKKGTCECAKCKKPRRDESPPVEAEVRVTAEHTLAA